MTRLKTAARETSEKVVLEQREGGEKEKGGSLSSSTPTYVAQVQLPVSESYYELNLLGLYSESRGFSPGTPVFASSRKSTFDLN